MSDESGEHLSDNPSPERTLLNPIDPQDVSQSEFLNYFSLATHEVYKEMQNKRAERKRRSTANPHFLYGNKEWGFFTQSVRTYYKSVCFILFIIVFVLETKTQHFFAYTSIST